MRFLLTGAHTKFGSHYTTEREPSVLSASVFDADYYRTSLFSGHQNNTWVSSGLVVRLGGASPE